MIHIRIRSCGILTHKIERSGTWKEVSSILEKWFAYWRWPDLSLFMAEQPGCDIQTLV